MRRRRQLPAEPLPVSALTVASAWQHARGGWGSTDLPGGADMIAESLQGRWRDSAATTLAIAAFVLAGSVRVAALPEPRLLKDVFPATPRTHVGSDPPHTVGISSVAY